VYRAVLATLGEHLYASLELLGGSWKLITRTAYWSLAPLFRKTPLNGEAIGVQMVRVGLRSVPMVCIVNIFVGMILAVSMAGPMEDVGLLNEVAKIVAIAVTRQLAPMMTAIVMSGFVGAAMTAELGTMTVSEEVLALEVSGINPVRFLVVPRMIAVVAMLPCLTVLANFMGMFGGYLVGTHLLGIGSARYLSINNDAASAVDIVRGLFKAMAFGAIITSAACHLGLGVSSGAEGVGRATTRSVVVSILAIIVADLFFTTLFYYVMGA
jgi:phospholipid/cholesterol/gamma-HCH transport system permease protein